LNDLSNTDYITIYSKYIY